MKRIKRKNLRNKTSTIVLTTALVASTVSVVTPNKVVYAESITKDGIISKLQDSSYGKIEEITRIFGKNSIEGSKYKNKIEKIKSDYLEKMDKITDLAGIRNYYQEAVKEINKIVLEAKKENNFIDKIKMNALQKIKELDEIDEVNFNKKYSDNKLGRDDFAGSIGAYEELIKSSNDPKTINLLVEGAEDALLERKLEILKGAMDENIKNNKDNVFKNLSVKEEFKKVYKLAEQNLKKIKEYESNIRGENGKLNNFLSKDFAKDNKKAEEFKKLVDQIKENGEKEVKEAEGFLRQFKKSKEELLKKDVVSNDKPVITANNVTIKANTPINLLTDKAIGLTATDKEDGTITNKVTVKSNGGLNVNDPKVGTYKVVYTVTDRDGNTTEKEITVTVVSNDKAVKDESTNKPNHKITLPATGATSSLHIIGSILVGLGGLFASKKKKNK